MKDSIRALILLVIYLLPTIIHVSYILTANPYSSPVYIGGGRGQEIYRKVYLYDIETIFIQFFWAIFATIFIAIPVMDLNNIPQNGEQHSNKI